VGDDGDDDQLQDLLGGGWGGTNPRLAHLAHALAHAQEPVLQQRHRRVRRREVRAERAPTGGVAPDELIARDRVDLQRVLARHRLQQHDEAAGVGEEAHVLPDEQRGGAELWVWGLGFSVGGGGWWFGVQLQGRGGWGKRRCVKGALRPARF